jgi:O-antigen ligase
MASSDGAAAAADPLPAAPSLAPSATASERHSTVPADWFAIAVGLVLPWWLPLLSQTAPTFYKEWLFVLAFAFAGLIGKPLAAPASARTRADPMVLAAIAAIAVLLVQAFAFPGVAPRATLAILSAAFFIFSIALGRRIGERRDDSLAWIAKCLLVAALGSCLLAAAQLLLPGLPLVLPRTGPRLSANVAQANHFCDLLWLGCVATAYLHASGRLGARMAIALVVVMQAFAATSGARMAWLYAVGLGLLGVLCWWQRRDEASRRLGVALMALVIGYGLVTAIFAGTGLLESFGITSAEQRVAGGSSEGSTAQRLWFWRVGIGAAVDHPLWGVGAGRFPGEGLDLAMRVLVAPNGAADAQAHNIFVQLAAECGIPLALVVAAALVVWMVRAWRGTRGAETFAVIAMALPILIHANLEHPLGYLYFLGLLGLLFGQLRGEPAAPVDAAPPRGSPELLRYASFVVLAIAALAYVQFTQVERAMQLLAAQVRAGATPQPTRELAARLDAVPRWSLFGDYAELIALISAQPSAANADELSQRCERSVAIGPSPQLLARCATILQVAGRAERAAYFANALCKIYPEAAPTLIQSMTYVEQTSPAVENLRSTCVTRTN